MRSGEAATTTFLTCCGWHNVSPLVSSFRWRTHLRMIEPLERLYRQKGPFWWLLPIPCTSTTAVLNERSLMSAQVSVICPFKELNPAGPQETSGMATWAPGAGSFTARSVWTVICCKIDHICASFRKNVMDPETKTQQHFRSWPSQPGTSEQGTRDLGNHHLRVYFALVTAPLLRVRGYPRKESITGHKNKDPVVVSNNSLVHTSTKGLQYCMN